MSIFQFTSCLLCFVYAEELNFWTWTLCVYVFLFEVVDHQLQHRRQLTQQPRGTTSNHLVSSLSNIQSLMAIAYSFGYGYDECIKYFPFSSADLEQETPNPSGVYRYSLFPYVFQFYQIPFFWFFRSFVGIISASDDNLSNSCCLSVNAWAWTLCVLMHYLFVSGGRCP